MSIPRPKLLSVVTIPTGGWTVDLYVSDGAQFNTLVQFTMSAGDYFVAWDNQSDDFLQEFMSQAYTALVASAVGGYADTTDEGKPTLWIDSDHKVNVVVYNQELRIDWTAEDGSSVADVLGFDSSATLDLSADTASTADWQHAYGWYADADGYLTSAPPVDISVTQAIQDMVPGGQVITQYLAQTYRSEIGFNFVPSSRVFSSGVDYTTTSVDPYARNVPLECWWLEACQGKRFRFYEDSVVDTAKAEVSGSSTGSTATTVTDTGRSFTIDPQEHKDKLFYDAAFGNLGSHPMRYFISSHTATVLTLANSVHNTNASGANTYYIFDQRYRTYVLDIGKMKEFAPREISYSDKYDITIPVKRYVA